MNDLIKKRDERTERRKKYKKKVDSMFNLSYKDDEKMMLSAGIKKLSDTQIRLLDEGAIVGDEYIDFIIKKGTLQKYMDGRNEYLPNLEEGFVGSVNLGHLDFATFPFIIGEWTKNDLSLVELDDERYGIDVNLRLDSGSVFVKELERQPYDIGISSEFYYHVDWESTEAIGYLVIDEVYIFAYGLVGECGNVNSSGLELKGDFNMTKEQLEELKAKMDAPETETEEVELSAEVEAEEETIEEAELNTEEVSEDTEEAPVEELSEEEVPAEEADGEAELSVSEEAEGEEGVEDAEEAEGEEATYEDVEAYISELQEQVASLTAENAELKKTNNRLQKKLKAEKSKKDEFVSKFASVAKTMGVTETETPEQNKVTDYVFGDGIGE